MRNRSKFDWSKPFKFIDNKKAFDELDVTDESLIIVINPDQQKQPVAQKKEDILVPKIDQVKRVTQVKKFAKITPNYIRLPPHLNLPSAHQYQLTEVDHVFLKSHQNRFVFNGKKILNQQFLRKVFIDLQLKAGKDMTLPRSKGWIMAFFQREYKDILQTQNVEIFADTVYNYWKNRREELKFPLLRVLWKPNPDQYNHMLAFRPRERQKRSLRRTNRILEDDIIEQLNQEFTLIAKIVDRVQTRQELKFRQVQLQLNSFYAQCKNFISCPGIIDQFKPEERVKDKQKIKGFQLQMENYRSQKQSLENTVVQQVVANDIDQKQTIVNFLSSVVYEAQLLGISYEKIFYPNNSLVLERTKSLPQVVPVTQPIVHQKIQEEQRNPENLINVSLYKFNNLLIRDLSEQESPINHIKPCKDYLQFKRRKVDKYYFGSDDQGQMKDVRKNTASSFKKFMQMQQLTRITSTISAVSAVSEN